MSSNYWKAQQIINNYKKKWLALNPNIPERTGIYILTREDENGFKYAYIGQTKNKGGILTRLAEHLHPYKPQHIDLSLKAHKLYDEIENPYGWQVDWFECLESELDGYEQEYILKYANMGYQMRNKSIGGQGKGKVGLNENKASKGYYDGLKQGRINALKEIKEYFDKYLMFMVQEKPEVYKKNGEIKDIYLKKLKEFGDLFNERNENEDVN